MEDAGRGAPGGEPGLSPRTGGKAQGADAEGAVAEGGVVRRRGVGRGRRKTEVLILVITWATGCRARPTEGTGRAEGCGLQAAGGLGSRGRQGKEMVVDRRRRSMEHGRREGTRRVKRRRGHCEKTRMASLAAGDEWIKILGHGLPEEGSGSAAAEVGTVGYGTADRRERSGEAARRRRCRPV